MKITADTATSLGHKLGGLDLTEGEAALLHMMLEDDDEVAGFELDKSSTKIQTQARDTFRPLIQGALAQNWSFGADNASYMKIEM